jgi:transposase InsO family protein
LKEGPEQIVPTGPEQVWVADITYLPTTERVAYLSLVTDAYSRKIVGYHVPDTLQAESVSQAFKMALKTRRSSLPLVHHSDRGSQYCSAHYQEIHRTHGLRCSMTDGYDCYQNALAERSMAFSRTSSFCNALPTLLRQARWWPSRYASTTPNGPICP